MPELYSHLISDFMVLKDNPGLYDTLFFHLGTIAPDSIDLKIRSNLIKTHFIIEGLGIQFN